MLKPVFIEATDLQDAWFQCLVKIFEPGLARIEKVTQSSSKGDWKLKFDFVTIHILNPGSRPLIIPAGQPFDILLEDPPCLRHIDTRIEEGKLHFFVYFRSWDLWGGFPANLAALQLLKEYMASEIGVEDGEMICSSKGLHLYSYVWELAAKRVGALERLKELEEMKKQISSKG
jgi:hypothetical protein